VLAARQQFQSTSLAIFKVSCLEEVMCSLGQKIVCFIWLQLLLGLNVGCSSGNSFWRVVCGNSATAHALHVTMRWLANETTRMHNGHREQSSSRTEVTPMLERPATLSEYAALVLSQSSISEGLQTSTSAKR